MGVEKRTIKRSLRIMRGLLGIKAFAITTLFSFYGIKGSAAENQYYFFDGNTLDTNLWGDISGITGLAKGSLYETVSKGRLNFINPTSKNDETENELIFYYKPSLLLNTDWTVTLGAHNSAYCGRWGSNKLQIALFESGMLTGQNNNPENYVAQLGPDNSFNPNPRIWIRGSHNEYLSWPYGSTYYGGQEVSFKFVYTCADKKLKIFFSEDGVDPISNSYSFTQISNVTVYSTTSFNIALIFCRYASDIIPANTIVSDGQIWVDNFSVTYPSNNSIANTYSLVLQESQNLINWTSISTNTISNTNSQAFFRLQIQKR